MPLARTDVTRPGVLPLVIVIIEQYAAAAPDYSREFTEQVGRLGETLSAALGDAVRYDDDMNYNVGQRLTVHLGADGAPTSDEAKARYVLKAVVSFRVRACVSRSAFRRSGGLDRAGQDVRVPPPGCSNHGTATPVEQPCPFA